MSIKQKELAEATIYTGVYLSSIAYGQISDEIADKTYELLIDNLCVLGVTINIDELRQIDKVSKEKAFSIVRNTKSKLLSSLLESHGSYISNWFEFVFSVSLLAGASGIAPAELDKHLQELATQVGYPKSDFKEIMKNLTSDEKGSLSKFIYQCLEVINSPRIFISHAAADHMLAEEFANLFNQKSVQSFVANLDILPGTDWYEYLRDEIWKSDELLLILSPKSINSDWVMIEVGAAWALGKHITPAVIYSDIKSAPEPIKRFQAKDITTYSAREDLVDSIAKRLTINNNF